MIIIINRYITIYIYIYIYNLWEPRQKTKTQQGKRRGRHDRACVRQEHMRVERHTRYMGEDTYIVEGLHEIKLKK